MLSSKFPGEMYNIKTLIKYQGISIVYTVINQKREMMNHLNINSCLENKVCSQIEKCPLINNVKVILTLKRGSTDSITWDFVVIGS